MVRSDLLNVNSIASGGLVIGDHESLMLFGSESQSQLREFSKTMSAIILHDNNELEDSINDVLQKIDDFQCSPKSTFGFMRLQRWQHEHLIKNYNSLLVYIDKMVLYLQIQQAQLLKDINIFDRLETLIKECSGKLDNDIGVGETTLINTKKIENENYDVNEEMASWNIRLERRLEALRISYTISLQSMAQLKLMRNNNRQLVDKIAFALSSIIPAWRNQITLLLGIEKFTRDAEIQKRISDITNTYIQKNNKKIYNKKLKNIDMEEIAQLNNKLIQSLKELLLIEKQYTDIRREFDYN